MKRNTLTTAVVAGLTGMAGMVSVSNAVNVNPDGMGQVLLYPYYSARGGNDTLISIVNTTERGKAVKIRFIEALNSREVLDFNIYMSPYDVWTGVVTAEGEGGKIVTGDTTCTVPYFYDATAGIGEQAFLDFDYTDDATDGGPAGIERTASGYIEVIEMGTLLATPEKKPAATAETYPAWAVKHADGKPGNCAALVNAWTDYNGGTIPAADVMGEKWVNTPNFGFDTERGASGGVYGAASIINVADGTMFSYNATAIDGFYAQGDMNHVDPGNLLPALNSGTNDKSFIFNNGALLEHTWAEELFAVNAVLMHDKIMNEYVTDASIGARTEWVVTFPTKHFHVGSATPIAPFTRGWYNAGTATAPNWKLACEDLTFKYYDREERPDAPQEDEPTPTPPIVSPAPPEEDTPTVTPDLFQLCREANVVRFASDDTIPAVSEILKEPVRTGTQLGYVNFELPYTEGWVAMDLANVDKNSAVYKAGTQIRQAQATNQEYLNGLPVIGFGVTTYTNGNIGAGVLANYGGTFAHRATRAISS